MFEDLKGWLKRKAEYLTDCIHVGILPQKFAYLNFPKQNEG